MHSFVCCPIEIPSCTEMSSTVNILLPKMSALTESTISGVLDIVGQRNLFSS